MVRPISAAHDLPSADPLKSIWPYTFLIFASTHFLLQNTNLQRTPRHSPRGAPMMTNGMAASASDIHLSSRFSFKPAPSYAKRPSEFRNYFEHLKTQKDTRVGVDLTPQNDSSAEHITPSVYIVLWNFTENWFFTHHSKTKNNIWTGPHPPLWTSHPPSTKIGLTI